MPWWSTRCAKSDSISTRQLPRLLTPELTQDATWLITMGCGDACPVVPGVSRGDWSWTSERPAARSRASDSRRSFDSGLKRSLWRTIGNIRGVCELTECPFSDPPALSPLTQRREGGQAYLETIIPPEICKITDVKADGIQIVCTASCRGAAPKTVTTSYHGDRSEGTDSTGSKTEAKLVSACK